MRIRLAHALWSVLAWATVVAAQDTNLTRTEVTGIRNKLVAVQQAIGADPPGYLKESEDFSLPTDFNPAQGGKYWPITSSVRVRYTDRGAAEGEANLEKAAEEFQAKYAAAIASGDATAIERMINEMTRLQAAAMTPAARKDPLDLNVQLNMNPTVGIDPAAVVLERPGVIALRRSNVSSDRGEVTVYLDPVALKATEELAKIELRTADDGMPSKTGVYHVVIQLNGTLADLEAWVQTFDFDAMLKVIDPR